MTTGATCRACGARIRFIRTPAGKYMPVDHERVSGNDIEGDTLVTDDGEILKGDAAANGVGYIPHWGTCTKPELFRNK